MHLIDEQREMMNVFLSRTLTLSATEKICGDEIWQEYESLLHDQGMDYSEQRVRLHEIKCKMKMFVYQKKEIHSHGMNMKQLVIYIS